MHSLSHAFYFTIFLTAFVTALAVYGTMSFKVGISTVIPLGEYMQLCQTTLLVISVAHLSTSFLIEFYQSGLVYG